MSRKIDRANATRRWLVALMLALCVANRWVAGTGPSSRLEGSIKYRELWADGRYHEIWATGATIELRRPIDGAVVATFVADENGRFAGAATGVGVFLVRASWPGRVLAQRVVTLTTSDATPLDIVVPGAGCPTPEAHARALTDADIADAMRYLLTRWDEPTAQNGADTAAAPVILDRGVSAWMAELKGLPFKVLSLGEAKALANQRGRAVDTIAFTVVRVGAECVTITKSESAIFGEGQRDLVYLGGAAASYRFWKNGDDWEFELVDYTEH